MKQEKIPALYKKYFADKSDERRMMFQIIESTFHPEKGIYPGSFIHITPSFFIKNMTYIDSDKRLNKFFTDDKLIPYIEENKEYAGKPEINWFQSDYSGDLQIEQNSFDVMFSFYAGFISQSCKKYLKDGGILVCNNSHGDASLAFADGDYPLIGVIKRDGDQFKIIKEKLETFFIKKDGTPINKDKVLQRMSGENFTKKGYAYVFRYHRPYF